MSALVTLPPPAEAVFELVVRTRDNASKAIAVEQGKVIGVGRGEDNAIRLDCPSVSRSHLELHPTLDGLEVEDLGSSNGTVLIRAAAEGGNKQEALRATERVSMRVGDVLRVGSALLSLQARRRSLPPQKSVQRAVGGPRILLDPVVKQAYELITRAAATEISVLILGETGAGKEAMAETVHQRSSRSGGPFLLLNCAALSETLLESELFGHEKGAFTGAHSSKAGLLESTAGGTVFLDEVGELSLGTQAKLLRVLEERAVLRVGSTKPRRIDVRFVTATNRDLTREVRAGRFRGDLYYRISGVVVRIPPLRERPLELEPLARYFLEEFSAQMAQSVPELSSAAIEALLDYDWPGNVRELKNVMERAVLLAGTATITREHVLPEPTLFGDASGAGGLLAANDLDESTQVIARPREFGGNGEPSRRRSVRAPESARSSRSPESRRSRGTGAPPSSRTRDPAHEDEQRERLIRALEACGGNQTRAAELLGISRRTLINRLDRWKLPRPQKR
ncbi:MAG TPA: sigma 54-interacting transcriptional regulator [Polyangiaceae bacterium]|nr:sigma 54-interacting transcriptional regulator [Polyangiaceae bacterium]